METEGNPSERNTSQCEIVATREVDIYSVIHNSSFSENQPATHIQDGDEYKVHSKCSTLQHSSSRSTPPNDGPSSDMYNIIEKSQQTMIDSQEAK